MAIQEKCVSPVFKAKTGANATPSLHTQFNSSTARLFVASFSSQLASVSGRYAAIAYFEREPEVFGQYCKVLFAAVGGNLSQIDQAARGLKDNPVLLQTFEQNWEHAFPALEDALYGSDGVKWDAYLNFCAKKEHLAPIVARILANPDNSPKRAARLAGSACQSAHDGLLSADLH